MHLSFIVSLPAIKLTHGSVRASCASKVGDILGPYFGRDSSPRTSIGSALSLRGARAGCARDGINTPDE